MSESDNGRRPGRLRMAIMTDPRFSGGTSSAIAHEIEAVHNEVDLTFHGLKTKMFSGDDLNARLAGALETAGIRPQWAKGVVRSEAVAFHNLSCIKLDAALPTKRILCDRLYVICHENFLRPDGNEGFDVEHCLRLLTAGSVCRRRLLVPISPENRRNVIEWCERFPSAVPAGWEIADFDWFNICDFETAPPTEAPRDRRGRMSRAGHEKFPPMSVLETLFPPEAEAVRILGGDSLLLDKESIPPHWEVMPFGAERVEDFLTTIDFFVYYTNRNWRESFGRVLAEAIAAGKVVITDPDTARNFEDMVIGCLPEEVNGVISALVANPVAYQDFVLSAQASLGRFSGEAFVNKIIGRVAEGR